MPRAAFHRLASGALGALVAGTLYWLDIDVFLSSAVGLALVATGLTVSRVGREFPDRKTGEGWRDGRWTALSLGIANFGALVGLRAVPLSGGYRAAIAFLVLSVGLSAYVGGSLAEMERDRLRNDRQRPDGSGAADEA